MDDKRIEDMLRGSWSPEPPEGMRERVLRGSRQRASQRRATLRPSWRLALAGLGIAAVIMSNAVDRNTQLRLAEMTGQRPLPMATVVAQCPCTLGNWRTGVNSLLVDSGSEGRQRMKGDNTP